ncbi:MAG: hypothetical protein H0U54_03470, partial [Acidobacteria bacterium]|nr:hypothetical protein [Acidobacteriota bacterium]
MKSNPFSIHLWRKLSALLLTIALLTSPAFGQATAVAPKPAATLTAAEKKAATLVKVETIKEVTAALSAKEMEGRGTAQAGGERAAKYIADKFAKLGLKPLGDAGSYHQAIKFSGTQPLAESSFKAGDAALKFGADFIPAPPYMSELSEASGGLVFVTYGVVSPELKRDDLAGVDVKGKIVVMLNGKPKGVDEAVWKKDGNSQAVGRNLIGRGATALVIANVGTKQQPFSLINMYLSRRRVALGEAPAMPFKIPPIILAGDEGMEKLFAGTGMTYAEALSKAENGEAVSRELNKQAAISIKVKKEVVTGS